jgi:GTP-binding protein
MKKKLPKNQSPLPTAILVGRANVGKSTLFNRLLEKPTSLISPESGTTRDYQEAELEWQGKKFSLIDTGGLTDKSTNEFAQEISNKTLEATKRAHLILFVVNGKDGLLPEDLSIFKVIKKTGKPCILVITKLDNANKWNRAILDFSELGIDIMQTVSGTNGIGTGNLLDEIVKKLPTVTTKKSSIKSAKPAIRLAVVGKPNVGKSSLINSLLGYEKQIVSPLAHTTRGAQDINLSYQDRDIVLIDTAGMRRRSQKSNRIEKSSVNITLDKIKSGDIALLILDISEPLTFQDRHLTEHIVKSGNSILLVANKWDKVPEKDEKSMYRFTDYIHGFFPYLTWAPIIFTSAITKQRTQAMLDLALEIYDKRFHKISDSALQKFLKKMIDKHQPSRGKGAGHPYIYHIKQVDVNPPTFQITIKYKKSLHASYVRFLENNLRAEFDFAGTPLRLFITPLK